MSNGRPWSSDDISRLRRLVASGMTDGQISAEVGRCRQQIIRKRQDLSLKPGQSKAMSRMIARLRARQRARV